MTDQPAPIGHNHPPRKAFRTAPRLCMDCGDTFQGSHPKAMFCSPGCKAEFHNRSSKVGRVLVPLAKAWRAARGGAEAKKAELDLMTLICRILDEENAADRSAGRPSARKYVQAKAVLFGLDGRE